MSDEFQNLTIAEPEEIFAESGEKKDNKEMIKKYGIIALGILVALGIIYSIYYFLGTRNGLISPITNDGFLSGNMVMNPITGEMVSESKAEFLKNRPLAVMVNNHTDARPQSGLIYADIVFEIVAEGGITRLLPFYSSTIPEKIGPVRSTREYYLVLVKEIGDAMLMHIGWSPQALEAIEAWPVRSLGRGEASFWRENPRNVAVEHTAYINGKDVLARGLELGWGGISETGVWQFKDDATTYEAMPAANNITIDFWAKGDYSALFSYDAEKGVYLRSMGYDANGVAIPHKDQETGEQIMVKNVVVQFVYEDGILGDTSNRLTYDLIGTGKGLVFLDGKVIETTWVKEARDLRTKFFDLNGEEVKFNRGKIWVSVVPDRNIDQVLYN